MSREYSRGENAPQKPLRILHLASHTGINAGGAVEMMHMANGLTARGHHVVCAFHWRDGRSGAGERNFERLQKRGIECVTFRMDSLLSRVLGDGRRFRDFMRQSDFDIVHCHKPRAVRFALRNLRGWPAPKIIAHRGNSYPLDDNGRKWYGDPQMSAIICVAEELRRIAIEGGLDARKIVTNYTGIDVSLFDPDTDGAPIRREFGIADAAPTVGLVANFDGKKAHGEWLKAAVLIAQQRPDVKFLLVGRGAPPEFLQQLRDLKLEDKTIVTGFREDVPRLLAAMDVSINVSTRGEGLTGAMRESLAMKKPVVCTDVGGNRELVRDGETGRLIAPGDAESFARAVVELLRDAPQAALLAQNGYRLVMEKFNDENSFDGLESIYRAAQNGESPAQAMRTPPVEYAAAR